jgi:predicted TIM-barrel enzyme
MKIFGVIHLKGLPGSTSNSLPLDEIIKLAQNDIDTLTGGWNSWNYHRELW